MASASNAISATSACSNRDFPAFNDVPVVVTSSIRRTCRPLTILSFLRVRDSISNCRSRLPPIAFFGISKTLDRTSIPSIIGGKHNCSAIVLMPDGAVAAACVGITQITYSSVSERMERS